VPSLNQTMDVLIPHLLLIVYLADKSFLILNLLRYLIPPQTQELF